MSNDTAIFSVAKTIIDQIGTNTLMCIAAKNFLTVNEKLGGVQFKVGRNPLLRGGGTVKVVLDYSDTYDVTIKNNRGKVLYKASNIYCDMLAGPDGVIEAVTG